MILDGNSEVGSAKVYATQKEMNQHFEIEELKKQNESMKEALQFYANKDNWTYTDTYNFAGSAIHKDDEEILSNAYNDIVGGKLARQTLEKIK